MSLQTGTKLAQTVRPIIDPRNLTIEAFEVDGPLLAEKPSYLLVDDIREYGRMGFIIDSADEFVTPQDIIRLEELLDDAFSLDNITVEDQTGQKLGKVSDYTVEASSFVIQQLQVRRGLLKALNDTGLLINRSQIVEITNKKIIVKSTLKKIRQQVEVAPLEYVNPFRSTSPQVDQPR